MYYELYMDRFFLENLFFDFLLLWLTAFLGRLPRDFKRMAAGAFLGSVLACLFVVIPVKNKSFLLPGQVAVSIFMVKQGLAVQRKKLWKSLFLFYGTAFLLGGILEMLHSQITLPVILAGLFGAAIVVGMKNIQEKWKYKTQNIYEVTLVWNGMKKELRGLRDTGNQLKDPYFGKPVTVVEYRAVREFFNQKTKVLWIPYHSIGKQSGFMPGIELDYFLLQGDGEERRIEHPIVAISKEIVSAKGGYQMILPSVLTDD